MKKIYKIGNGSHKYGNIVLTNNIRIVNQNVFYNAIENSLKRYDLEKYRDESKLMKNLKKGIIIGKDFYLFDEVGVKICK
jgi:hypothetical protein